MALRNLNRVRTRGRICGTPKTGVLGSLIPSTGDSGAAYTYNDLSLPADNGKEICGRVTTMPSGGNLFAYEDTSFIFTATDGVYTFQYQLLVDGIKVGSVATVTLTVGSFGTVITCTVGNATASGVGSSVAQFGNLNINCSVGNASAGGPNAAVTQYIKVTITCSVGNAQANGIQATLGSAQGGIVVPLQCIVSPSFNDYTVSPEFVDYTVIVEE